VPEPAVGFRMIVSWPGGRGRMELHVGPFPQVERASYFLRVLVAANRPRSEFALELRDADGGSLGRCSYGPGGYRVDRHTQTTMLTCPVGDSRALRSVVLETDTPTTPASIRVGRREDGRYAAGGLVTARPKGAAAALERISAARPRAAGAPTMLLAVGLSWAALAAAGVAFLLGAVPPARNGARRSGDAGAREALSHEPGGVADSPSRRRAAEGEGRAPHREQRSAPGP
jgi:hypothetical protein